MAFTKEQCEKLGITFKEGMTDDEVFALVSEKHDEHLKTKASFDKASSELATLKKEKQATLSEEEKTKARIAELEAEIAKNKKDATIRDVKDQYVGLGYDADKAQKVANALVEGNYAEVAKIQKEFMEAHDIKMKEEYMKGNPKPNQGDPSKGDNFYTKENFRAGKIGYADLCELEAKNPALYKEITE